jgi:predicted RNA-binding Zn-ribbon protein involved in translation (DUF1610 family)
MPLVSERQKGLLRKALNEAGGCCGDTFWRWTEGEIFETHTSATISDRGRVVLFTRLDCPTCGKASVYVSDDARRVADED